MHFSAPLMSYELPNRENLFAFAFRSMRIEGSEWSEQTNGGVIKIFHYPLYSALKILFESFRINFSV